LARSIDRKCDAFKEEGAMIVMRWVRDGSVVDREKEKALRLRYCHRQSCALGVV
jgi:hypothetical protein